MLGGILVLAAGSVRADPPVHEEHTFVPTGRSDAEPYLIQKPKDFVTGRTYPLMVFLHGSGGSHRHQWLHEELSDLRTRAYERGYFVLSPHLGATHWMDERARTVLAELLDKTLADYPIDPARVHVMGVSMGAGGGLTFAAHHPDRVRSVCDVFGMTDFTKMYGARDYREHFRKHFGGLPEEIPDVYRGQSALDHVGAFARTPVLMFHGDADKVISVEHSRRFVAALREKGYRVSYRERVGLGHRHQVFMGAEGEIFDFFAAAEATPTDGRERTPENVIHVSFGDQIMIAHGDAQLDTVGKIQRSSAAWNREPCGRTILWRISDYYLRRFYENRHTSAFAKAFYGKVDEIRTRFEPVEVARDAARENGQTFLVYMTILDHGAPVTELYDGRTPFIWQDRFTIENPQYQTVDRKGRYHYGVLEMAYPESRRLMVERIRGFVTEFEVDGVYVCTRTHSLPAGHADQFGFSPPVVEEYRRRHGIDVLEDSRFDCADPSFKSDDPAVERWRRLRGEYLVRFYRELRRALPGKVIYTGIPRGRYLGPPYGNLYLDWETLARERLVDGLVIGVISRKGLHARLYKPHAEIGYLSSEDDGIAIPSPAEAVKSVYLPVA